MSTNKNIVNNKEENRNSIGNEQVNKQTWSGELYHLARCYCAASVAIETHFSGPEECIGYVKYYSIKN